MHLLGHTVEEQAREHEEREVEDRISDYPPRRDRDVGGATAALQDDGRQGRRRIQWLPQQRVEDQEPDGDRNGTQKAGCDPVPEGTMRPQKADEIGRFRIRGQPVKHGEHRDARERVAEEDRRPSRRGEQLGAADDESRVEDERAREEAVRRADEQRSRETEVLDQRGRQDPQRRPSQKMKHRERGHDGQGRRGVLLPRQRAVQKGRCAQRTCLAQIVEVEKDREQRACGHARDHTIPHTTRRNVQGVVSSIQMIPMILSNAAAASRSGR